MSSKMREALEEIREMSDSWFWGVTVTKSSEDLLMECGKIAELALAEPPRNCDVGTAEEQEERYIKLKREHIDKLARCPAMGRSFFPESLYWAQMPYEEVTK